MVYGECHLRERWNEIQFLAGRQEEKRYERMIYV
jgi:hypothetical protein